MNKRGLRLCAIREFIFKFVVSILLTENRTKSEYMYEKRTQVVCNQRVWIERTQVAYSQRGLAMRNESQGEGKIHPENHECQFGDQLKTRAFGRILPFHTCYEASQLVRQYGASASVLFDYSSGHLKRAKSKKSIPKFWNIRSTYESTLVLILFFHRIQENPCDSVFYCMARLSGLDVLQIGAIFSQGYIHLVCVHLALTETLYVVHVTNECLVFLLALGVPHRSFLHISFTREKH